MIHVIFLFFLGNIFVIAAIVLERNLQCVANYLILSLAVADLLVAVLVMPLGAVYEVRITFVLIKVIPRIVLRSIFLELTLSLKNGSLPQIFWNLKFFCMPNDII